MQLTEKYSTESFWNNTNVSITLKDQHIVSRVQHNRYARASVSINTYLF